MALAAAALAAASPVFAPQLLAFPYERTVGPYRVWSEVPLDSVEIRNAFEKAAAKVQRSPLARESEPRPVFLTRGEWRWRWLAFSSPGSYAITRPLRSAIIVNFTDPRTATVSNASRFGKRRTLASVVAHETAHGMIRRRFGFYADRIYPT